MSNEERRKLSDDAVSEIRRRYAAGETMRELAENFGVGKTTIHRAIHGSTYRWVDPLGDGALWKRYRQSRAVNGRKGAEVTNRRR